MMNRRSFLLALSSSVALPTGAGVAAAQDGSAWLPWNRANADRPALASQEDREFIREWESNPPKGYPTLSPANIAPTRAAVERYERIVNEGGWKPVAPGQYALGMSNPAIGDLRQRLFLSGDLKDDTSNAPDYFDHDIDKAVRRFQASNGLTPTGIVDKRTLAALNVPAQMRLRQLKVNAGRLQALAPSAGRRHLVVNIPAQQIEAVEADRVISRHAGVVGKIDRATPILRSAVHELNFNPVWHLPPTVISQDLFPKGREMQTKGQSVLRQFKIDAYDGSGRIVDPDKVNWSSPAARGLTFRQQPGPDNPMGFLKINFHNAHSVYLHDTPSDRLFGRNFRAASSGCVRVDNIEQLAAWLLADNGGWDTERVKKMKETRERLDVRLKRPVTLHLAYITAWATEDGIVQFRRDLYNKDGVGETASAY